MTSESAKGNTVVKVEDIAFRWTEIKAGNYDDQGLSDESNYVLNFVHAWLNETQNFTFHTSGSTGKPKKIVLSKEVLSYSAVQTLHFLDYHNVTDLSMLLCIPPHFIGGTMMIVRALVAEADLTVLPASLTTESIQTDYHLTSMVPIQVEKLLKEDPDVFKKLSKILIGGAAISDDLVESLYDRRTQFYHTYGMTETASHVAIRPISEKAFSGLGDVRFQLHKGNLKLKGTVTEGKWVETNDSVDLLSDRSFVWKGRVDFMINSGGIKINPEEVESLISKQIKERFAISSIPHKTLGNQLVLAIADKPFQLDFKELPKYHSPKKILWNQDIPLTKSGKIDRVKLREKLEDEYS